MITYDAKTVLDLLPNAKRLFVLPGGEQVRVSTTLRVFRDQGIRCVKCDAMGIEFRAFPVVSNHRTHRLELHSEKGMMTTDHIVPKSKGGNSHKLNTQPMCKECNVQKNSTLAGEVAYWLQLTKVRVFVQSRQQRGENWRACTAYVRDLLKQKYTVNPVPNPGLITPGEFQQLATVIERDFDIRLNGDDFEWIPLVVNHVENA